MSTDAWAAYQARQTRRTDTPAAPAALEAIPPMSDPLATTIRQALDARALGMSVEEHQLPGGAP